MSWNMALGATSDEYEHGSFYGYPPTGYVAEENPLTVAARTCDVKDCEELAVPGETHECANHQIIGWLATIEEIAFSCEPGPMDTDTLAYGKSEMERLCAL